MFDVVIIGAGICGCFLAHTLSKYDCKVMLVDKENDIANESTMANSAIIHAGEDPADGTLKAVLNVRGSRMYEDICRELRVSYRKTSAFVVATNEEENGSLVELVRKAKERSIPVQRLSREEALALEPNLADGITQVIELPTTAVVYPWEVSNALAEESVLNGVEVHLNEQVMAIEAVAQKHYLVKTNKGSYETGYVINAAGIYADRIARMVMKESPYEVIPRVGEYFVTDRWNKPFVNRVIYPAPSKVGKGILATPTVHGNLLMGPNSVPMPGREDVGCSREGLEAVKTGLKKIIKNPPYQKVVRNFAGLRASGNQGDFYIKEEEAYEGFIQVACIDSPGLSSAPAIAELVVNDIICAAKQFGMKKEWNHRRPPILMKQMTEKEKNAFVRENPAFGRVVCRCETVTEGEIIDCIRRPLGATTVKGVKKRVRPGMGRCQGGFCEPLVVEILARELGISQMEVCYDQPGSELLKADLNQ